MMVMQFRTKDRSRGFLFCGAFYSNCDGRTLRFCPSSPVQIGSLFAVPISDSSGELTVFHGATELRELAGNRWVSYEREQAELSYGCVGKARRREASASARELNTPPALGLSAQLRITASRSICHSRVDALSPKRRSIRRFFSISEEIALDSFRE